MTGYHAGTIGGKKNGRADNFFRTSFSSCWRTIHKILVRLCVRTCGNNHGRIKEGRRNRVHLNVVRREFNRESSCQLDYTALTGKIRNTSWVSDETANGSEIDDFSPALRRHLTAGNLATEKCAGQIHTNNG